MSTVIDAIMRLKDQFSPVLHQVSKSATEHEKIQKRLGKSLENTKKQFESMSSGAMIGGAALAGAIGNAVKANMELGAAMGKLDAAGAMSGQSMDGMKESIEKTAKAAHMARADIANLYLTAKQGGMEAAQIEGTVAAAVNYAKVAGMDKAEAVKTLSQITRAWTLTEKDQAMAMDQAAAVASRSGQDLGALQTTLAGMSEHAAHAGVSFADLTTTLGYMQGNMHMTSEQASGALNGMFSVIEGGSPKAAKALAGIGMSTQELAENVKNNGLAPAMAEVAQKVAAQGGDVEGTLKKITGSTEGAKLAMQLMSQDGMDNFQDLAGAAHDAAGTIQKGLGEMGKNPAVQMANAKQDMLTEFQSMVDGLMPVLTVGMQVTTMLLKGFMALPEPIKGGIEAFAGLVVGAVAVTMVLGTLGSVVVDGVQLMLKAAPAIAKVTKAIRGFSFAAMANPVGLLVAAIALLVVGLVYAYNHCETFRNIVNSAFSAIVAKVQPAMEHVKAAIEKAMQKAQQILARVSAYIQTKLQQLSAWYEAHAEQVDAVMNALANGIGTALSVAIEYFTTAFSVIGDVIAVFINVAGDLIGFIVDVFTGDWSGAWEHIKAIFTDVFDGIKNVFHDFTSGISAALDHIIGKSAEAKAAAQDAQSGGNNGHNASGTDNWRGGLTWINEQGGELVDLPKGSRVYPHDKSLQMEYARGKREAFAGVNGNNFADLSREPEEANDGHGISITVAKLADSIIVRDQRDIDEIANAIVFKLKGYAINGMTDAV